MKFLIATFLVLLTATAIAEDEASPSTELSLESSESEVKGTDSVDTDAAAGTTIETAIDPAQPAPAKSATSQAKSGGSSRERINVLDFEGEVIEGERKRPDLFLQVSPQSLNFDSLLYQRSNFNDYLEVDRRTRNRYFKTKR